MVSVEEDESFRGVLPRIQPCTSNRAPFSKVAGVLDDVRTGQGGRLRSVVRRSIVDDYHLARELSGLKDDGADRRPFIEGGDGHKDLRIRKRPAQDRGNRRRRLFEQVSIYPSVRRPARKTMP